MTIDPRYPQRVLPDGRTVYVSPLFFGARLHVCAANEGKDITAEF